LNHWDSLNVSGSFFFTSLSKAQILITRERSALNSNSLSETQVYLVIRPDRYVGYAGADKKEIMDYFKSLMGF